MKSRLFSSSTVSCELDVMEEDMERAGVDAGVAPCLRARASAFETADRYDAAVDIAGVDFFLKIDCPGDAGFKAIGDDLEGISSGLRDDADGRDGGSCTKRRGARVINYGGVG